MGRWRGTTQERGVGYKHQADKRRLLAALRDGDPCWRCGQPMYRWQALDRDHVIPVALGGAGGPGVLAHARCNRSAGAVLGNLLAGRTWKPRPRSMPRGTRACPVCGTRYSPSYRQQRTCSRTCGIQWRRMYGDYAGKPAPPPKPAARKW